MKIKQDTNYWDLLNEVVSDSKDQQIYILKHIEWIYKELTDHQRRLDKLEAKLNEGTSDDPEYPYK